jgi:2-polyprenyl-3-methyl-5-hydroxy-6-metoxy-1,4-benzoquinol methylase
MSMPVLPRADAVAAHRECPACGSATFLDRRLLVDLETHACRSCGLLLSTVSRAGAAVPEFALVDQDAYIRSVGVTRRRQAAQILTWLGRHMPSGQTLFDIGCSFGFFLQEAKRAGFIVRGLEPDDQAYAYAVRLLGDGVVAHGTFDGQTVAPRSIDIISTLDLIEHIPADEHRTFASLVSAALSPGGVWLIKVPTTEGLFYKISDILARTVPSVGGSLLRRMWQTRYEYPHLVYFSLKTLSLWLDRFGFTLVAHHYVSEVPTGTVIDRLTTDRDISRVRAYLAAPAVVTANGIDSLRGKTDSLVVIARPRR